MTSVCLSLPLSICACPRNTSNIPPKTKHCSTQYAQSHGFTITRTYRDSAKSGLWLKGRPGLRELLRDVTEGKTDWSILRRMTCGEPLRSCATRVVASWSRFSSCWDMHRSRLRNAMWAANRIPAIR